MFRISPGWIRRPLFVASFALIVLIVSCIGREPVSADSASSSTPEPDPSVPTDMEIFLLFGQSNMEGVPKPGPAELQPHPRVFVLGYDDCGDKKYDAWSPATPPLHRCWAGVGPGDSFGKAMAEAWPRSSIGLVPAAISGVDIAFFRKGVVSKRRQEFEIPPDNSASGAYGMLVARARLAQKNGRIRGILFHQGESDTGRAEWVDEVAEIVADLRADLSLGDDVPFVAGELPYTGCCASHNRLVNQLPSKIPNAHVVSAEGLTRLDAYHFDLESQRILGQRYAEAVLEVLGADKGPPPELP